MRRPVPPLHKIRRADQGPAEVNRRPADRRKRVLPRCDSAWKPDIVLIAKRERATRRNLDKVEEIRGRASPWTIDKSHPIGG